jgi:tRNA(His) guanylyltransferase
MAKSRFEYVKHFELDDRILPATYIVVRVDGRGFSKFTDAHGYLKPNDSRGLALMLECAAQVMKEWGECIIAFGESDEFSFVFPPQASAFGRRSSKLSTGIVSLFASSFVMYWSKFFPDKELLFPPAFDARCVAYPTKEIVCDYLKWRQVDSWINSMYNECFWALQQKGEYRIAHR